MNYTQKILLALLGIFLLPALFLLLVCWPQAREYSKLQAQEKMLNQGIMGATREISQLPEIRKEIEHLRGRLAKLKQQYPLTIEPFYRQISRAAKKMGLNILSMVSVPDAHPEEGNLAVERRYVRITARCSYQDLGKFLDEIHNLPVIVSVSNLSLAGRRSVLPQLDVELLLTTYLGREE